MQLCAKTLQLYPHGLQPARLLCLWDSPGKNTAVSCHTAQQNVLLIWWFTSFIDSEKFFAVVAQPLSRVQLCDPMNCSTQDFPVLYLPEFAQTHVHWVSDAIQPAHPLLPPFPPALNHSQHQGLFQRVGSSYQVAKVLQLQHQSFQWIFRADFL